MAVQRRRLCRGIARGARLLFCALLPLAGLCAELGLRMLEAMLVLFPSRSFEVLAVVGVLANLALHLPLWRSAALQPLRALLYGCALGSAVLFGVVELPAVPVMVMLAVAGLGVLAMAPYFSLLGLVLLWRPLRRSWHAGGRSRRSLYAVVLFGPLWVAFWVAADHQGRHRGAAAAIQLRAALASGDQAAVAVAAAAVRAEDSAQLEACCRDQWFEVDSGWGTQVPRGDFWFLAKPRSPQPFTPAEAQRLWYCAFGVPWRQGRADRRGGAQWLSSQFEARVEVPAGVARVDWLAEVSGTGRFDDDAQFEIELPPGAVASSLSLWIGGVERPAAFAPTAQAQAAYDRVVAKARDPALLRELAPGRLRLELFPLSVRRPAMRVRLGVTVPLVLRDEGAWLVLPNVVESTCAKGLDRHHVVLDDGTKRSELVDVAGAGFLFPAPVARVFAADAAGHVQQTVVARRAVAPAPVAVLVVEASCSAAAAMPDPGAVLDAFPEGTRALVFVAEAAGFVRLEGWVGQPALREALAAVPRVGGVDARRALVAALDAAEREGAGRVWFVHGDAGVALSELRPEGPPREVMAMALAPGMRCLGASDPRAAIAVRRLPVVGRGLPERLRELAAFVARDGEAWERRFERPAAPAADAVQVSDQLARLWAGIETRRRAATNPVEAVSLAMRYRLVTAGTAAVVLETVADYAAFDLHPGAVSGREPEGPVGSPTPEPATWLLVSSGLAILWLVRRRFGRAA
jgi:hypothetical protein